jgi:hypothetical protein
LPAFASCTKEISPEAFCSGWVEDTCQVRAGCCEGGATFDLDECRLELSDACQSIVDVEKIHSGEYVLDLDAAGECLGQIPTCGSVKAPQQYAFERARACSNAVTGFRPLGAACESSQECAQTGDYAICYTGVTGGNRGVCARVAPTRSNDCSFSFATNEVLVCPETTYCEISAPDDPTALPSERAFEFFAICKSFPGVDEPCINGIPCADGLHCAFTGTEARCASRKAEGATCGASPDECAEGLSCSPAQDGSATCVKATKSAPYCVTVPVCGDGSCDPGETPVNCPQDCGGGGLCGDAVCSPGEQATCPQDCGAGCTFPGDPCAQSVDCCTGSCDPQSHRCQ